MQLSVQAICLQSQVIKYIFVKRPLGIVAVAARNTKLMPTFCFLHIFVKLHYRILFL